MDSSLTPVEGSGRGRIVARGLTRRFGEHVAVEPFDIEMGPGGIVGLLGPNGSGKSTFLRMLIGLVRPDAGSAVVDGVTLAGDGTAIRRRVTYAPGEIGLYGEMRSGEMLAWLLRGRGKEALERARTIAGELGLPLGKAVHAYSHGMKRQLLFAAAMAPRAAVRILDEPSEGLDPNKRSAILTMLTDDARDGSTILLSSHHFGEVDRACDTFVFLNRGELIRREAAEEVRRRAARLVHVVFGPEVDDPAVRRELERAAEAWPGVSRLDGRAVTVELDGDDPRPLLAALGGPGTPPPRSIEYGRVSLAALYRDLYGVEAC